MKLSAEHERIAKVAKVLASLPGADSGNHPSLVPKEVVEAWRATIPADPPHVRSSPRERPAWFSCWNEAARFVAAHDALAAASGE